MKLEAGKYYRTRDERKAYVAAVLSPFKHLDPDFLAIGWIEGSDSALARMWNPNTGAFITDDSCQADLVAEWKEPKIIKGWLNIYSENSVGDIVTGYIYPTLERARSVSNNSNVRAICEISCVEGDGLNN